MFWSREFKVGAKSVEKYIRIDPTYFKLDVLFGPALVPKCEEGYFDSVKTRTDTLKKQTLIDGVGPVHHRVYAISIPAPKARVRETMLALQMDPNSFSPQLLAKFEKTKGSSSQLKPGDEFMIRITGPWNGPVRVTEVSQDKFRFVTLEGHLEAGEILFEIVEDGEAHTNFVIESIARSRTMLSILFMTKFP